MNVRKLVFSFTVLSLAIFCSCNQVIVESIKHYPIHAQPNEDVSMELEAIAKRDNIKTVRLYAYETEGYYNSNGIRSGRNRSGGVSGLVKEWNFSRGTSTVSVSHTINRGFPDNSGVTYRFYVESYKGKKKNRYVAMSAGDLPWSNSNQILYVMSPTNSNKAFIDIIFIADEDYDEDWNEFFDDLEELVYEGFLENNMLQDYNKMRYRFWFSKSEGDAERTPTKKLEIPTSVENNSNIDAFAILHKTTFRDFRRGKKFGTEPQNRGTAVHETGHAVFNLSDEYNDSYPRENTEHPNVFADESDCKDHNRDNGWQASDCESFKHQGTGDTWWRPEPASIQCMMWNDADTGMPDFARSCQKRIRWYYGNL